MSEEKSDVRPVEGIVPAPKVRMGRRIGVGLALVVLPVGAGYVAWHLKQGEERQNKEMEKSFSYETEALRYVDPAMIKYKEVGRIEVGMRLPRCIAIGMGGRILVGGDRMVKVLDGRGMLVSSFAISGEAEAIAEGTDGCMYVGLKDHVEVYGADGKLKASWGSLGDRAMITSLAVGKEDVYVADAGQRVGRVLRYSLDGKSKGELGRQDAKKGIAGLITPSPHLDVAVNAEGMVWVANPGRHQMELYTPEGELQRTFGSGGAAVEEFLGCCNPSQFALFSDGRIVTAEKGIPRVKVYQSDGHLESFVAGPRAFGDNRAGIDLAADGAGRVLVLEPGMSVIRVFVGEKS